eukprot:5722749-Pyramimonas_sp.AAC.1
MKRLLRDFWEASARLLRGFCGLLRGFCELLVASCVGLPASTTPATATLAATATTLAATTGATYAIILTITITIASSTHITTY